MIYVMALKHDHVCDRAGERVLVEAQVVDGTYRMPTTVCVETESELRIVARWTEA